MQDSTPLTQHSSQKFSWSAHHNSKPHCSNCVSKVERSVRTQNTFLFILLHNSAGNSQSKTCQALTQEITAACLVDTALHIDTKSGIPGMATKHLELTRTIASVSQRWHWCHPPGSWAKTITSAPTRSTGVRLCADLTSILSQFNGHES